MPQPISDALSPLQSHQAPIHVAAVSLRVRDLAAVAAYYETAIGLERIAATADRITLGAGGVGFLHLLAAPAAKPEPRGSAGLFHTAFLLPSRAHLGAWFKAAHDRNVTFDGASDHGVSDAFYLTDPEGNGIEVYSDRPAASWGRPVGGKPFEVLMTTAPMDVAAVVAEATKLTVAEATKLTVAEATKSTVAEAVTLGAAAAAERFPPDARIGHVHLKVGDIATATAFYTAVLGLDRTYGRSGAAFFAAGGYHHHVATNIWSSAGAGPRDASCAGLASVEFSVGPDHPMAVHAPHIDDPWGNRLTVTIRPGHG
jgi:catechol 2,3-dioxygenase